MFRPVDDGTIAQIISRVDVEKMRQVQLSAAAADAASCEQMADDSRAGLTVDEVISASVESHQAAESPGW